MLVKNKPKHDFSQELALADFWSNASMVSYTK